MLEQAPQKQKKKKTTPTSLVLRIPIRPTTSRPTAVPQPEQTQEAIEREEAQPESQREDGPDPIILPFIPEPELVQVPVRDKSAISVPTELNRPEPSMSTPWEASLAQITQSFQQTLES